MAATAETNLINQLLSAQSIISWLPWLVFFYFFNVLGVKYQGRSTWVWAGKVVGVQVAAMIVAIAMGIGLSVFLGYAIKNSGLSNTAIMSVVVVMILLAVQLPVAVFIICRRKSKLPPRWRHGDWWMYLIFLGWVFVGGGMRLLMARVAP